MVAENSRDARAAGGVDRTPHTYHVLLKDAVPAYITWEQYEQNVARLVANRAHADTLGRCVVARRC